MLWQGGWRCAALTVATLYPALTFAQYDTERATRKYEREREAAHATMPDTMHASTPSAAMPPHAATVSELAERLTAANMFRSSSWEATFTVDETATDVFREYVSPVVQDKCINCHVAGGPSGHTRLVFVPSSNADHLALNQGQFEDFLADVEGGADVILNKIRGVGHGGGTQVPAGGEEYRRMAEFLALIGGTSSTVTLTPGTLFDGLTMAPDRKTLRRAAIIFAGRVPTQEEYDLLDGGGIREAIRSLMTGEAFHSFVIRSSNDRLLTDREDVVLSNASGAPLVNYVNEWVHRCQIARANNDFFADDDEWVRRAQYGARRAPLELIAHVVENDLPYTEILTANYVMANPWSARAYGTTVPFEDPGDVHEFQPVLIVRYYLFDDTRAFLDDRTGCGAYILDPGELVLEFPHAGILNTMVFLRRYPTTATNRNRARARWTYYHFLGLDVEKSASRTTDPVALADTDNPTLKNPACIACHIALDPVAGAFQNYSDVGHYRANQGGMDSLDYFYKRDPVGGEDFVLEASSYNDRERVFAEGHLVAGSNAVGVKAVGRSRRVAVEGLTVRDEDGGLVARYTQEELSDQGGCGSVDANELVIDQSCVLAVDVNVPRAGRYRVSVDAWDAYPWDDEPALLRVWVPGYFYREGDTWYRDMRAPGFGLELVPDADNSAQWLAETIVADERFAEATVKFWWPAIMGDEVAAPPELVDDADFDGQLLRASAQVLEVERLADLFRNGIRGGSPYNLKDLLVEITLSKWFTVEEAGSDDAIRAVALRGAGGGRLLTGEELAAKTLALTGVQWGRLKPTTTFRGNPAFTTEKHALSADYAILYGGIDSDGVTERARDLTSVMVGVARRHAVKVSCPVVLREFYLLPSDERLLFAGIDVTVSPADADGAKAIRDKLAELHDTLLGVAVDPMSSDVSRTYDFFVEVWNRKRQSVQPGQDGFIGGADGVACDLATDEYYFETLPDNALVDSDLSDPHHLARTWVVMLAALLIDHRYLHL